MNGTCLSGAGALLIASPRVKNCPFTSWASTTVKKRERSVKPKMNERISCNKLA